MSSDKIDTVTKSEELKPPKRMTLRWLIDHVPLDWYWKLALAVVPVISAICGFCYKYGFDQNSCAQVSGKWVRKDKQQIQLTQVGCLVNGVLPTDPDGASHEIKVALVGNHGYGYVRRNINGCTTYLSMEYEMMNQDRLRIIGKGNGCDVSNYLEDEIYSKIK